MQRGRAHDRISDSRRAANRNRAAGAPVSAGSVRVVGQGDLPRAAGDALARRMSAPVALFVVRPCGGVRACGRTGVRAARVPMRDAERSDFAAAVTEAGAEARLRCGLRIDDGAPAAHPLASAGQ
ncbi:hypothetical protein GSH10_05845 [Burkholderia pseudomallei]|nr:hypothetical protein T210_0114795 [Burkholderia pseudomallei MSHR6137]MBM5590162.1 hypothetical protein [Burkholderia pseudomallei]OMZ09572.1 hypothetical protein AQ857_00805 [Burkholderia pseudomallei]OMZ18114.1 hypothetical protein AQ858_30670 [Burkholderia pseudomallei]ONC55263.1 hypothetical protein AQ919_20390 [Burkholderia pseudomallei]